MVFDLDVFIPTLKQRLNGLVCNIHTIFNSGLNVRVTISLPDNDYPELMELLTEKEKECIRFVPNVPQGEPSIPIKHCLENVELLEWVYLVADDDCVLPWGLQHLWEAREGYSMVMGQVLGVSRNKHLDFTAWKIGFDIIESHVSTAMYNMRSLEKLPKPWYEISPISDYLLIRRMAENFTYNIIPSVVHVQAFAELDNLGPIFMNNFSKLYGHLL